MTQLYGSLILNSLGGITCQQLALHVVIKGEGGKKQQRSFQIHSSRFFTRVELNVHLLQMLFPISVSKIRLLAVTETKTYFEKQAEHVNELRITITKPEIKHLPLVTESRLIHGG
jgi:hypothetical protein